MDDDFTLTAKNIHNFWRYVARGGPDECWPWIGRWKRDEGYGRFGVDGRNVQATHIALVLDGRPQPPAPRDHALHGDCSNPACCNPRHLRWGSRLENMADKVRLMRQHRPRGGGVGKPKLTEEAVREIRASPMKHLDLAAKFGVSRQVISGVKRGTMWTHVT